ncbi:MAG: sigma 54-interacting transcriptional regulator [Thermodesulfobacteriota bacterium]|nr:sigma 54-interacting transcriptional regulator [Thermodesulfobacteriota bacterium]
METVEIRDSLKKNVLKGISRDSVLENMGEAILIIDPDFRVVYFNKRAEEITGLGKTEALGKYCYEVLRLTNCEDGCPANRMIEEGENFVDYSSELVLENHVPVPVAIRFSILKDSSGLLSGGIIAIRDLPTKYKFSRSPQSAYSFQKIISKNKRILEIFEILPDISKTDVSILIQGESGTGKELFANAVHKLSLRQKAPLIKVNCAALPETLLESEFFGYVKGAFTDAKKDKPGRFQLADGGTIFLDEIGDISSALQVKLLRAVQDKEFVPLGGTKTVKVDVRVISATNRNLEQLVKEGRFRQDLYYRLNVIKLELPALRERPEDIPLLVDHFIGKFNQKNQRGIKRLSSDALDVLLQYEYPGNVRELENILEHAYIFCKGDTILKANLPSYIMGIQGELERIDEGSNLIHRVETDTILSTLRRHNWNKIKTADELGIHRSTLWRKLKRMGL